MGPLHSSTRIQSRRIHLRLIQAADQAVNCLSKLQTTQSYLHCPILLHAQAEKNLKKLHLRHKSNHDHHHYHSRLEFQDQHNCYNLHFNLKWEIKLPPPFDNRTEPGYPSCAPTAPTTMNGSTSILSQPSYKEPNISLSKPRCPRTDFYTLSSETKQVQLADGQTTNALGKINAALHSAQQKIKLADALYVPTMVRSLVSAAQLTPENDIIMQKNKLYVVPPTHVVPNNVTTKGKARNGVVEFDQKDQVRVTLAKRFRITKKFRKSTRRRRT